MIYRLKCVVYSRCGQRKVKDLEKKKIFKCTSSVCSCPSARDTANLYGIYVLTVVIDWYNIWFPCGLLCLLTHTHTHTHTHTYIYVHTWHGIFLACLIHVFRRQWWSGETDWERWEWGWGEWEWIKQGQYWRWNTARLPSQWKSTQVCISHCVATVSKRKY